VDGLKAGEQGFGQSEGRDIAITCCTCLLDAGGAAAVGALPAHHRLADVDPRQTVILIQQVANQPQPPLAHLGMGGAQGVTLIVEAIVGTVRILHPPFRVFFPGGLVLKSRQPGHDADAPGGARLQHIL